MEQTLPQRAPGHLWLVGVLALLWNAMGAFDYSMSHLRGAEYLREAGMNAAAITWFEAIPVWTTAGWALGVWGGVAGAVLLLLRSRHAVTAFAVSLAGVIAMTLSAYLVHPYPAGMMSAGAMAFEWTIKLVAVLLLIYAVRMRARGVLR